jgi:hypothetical protein
LHEILYNIRIDRLETDLQIKIIMLDFTGAPGTGIKD